MKYSESLKKTKDFQNVYRRGKSYANRYLVMYVLSNQTEGNRLGISVSKKVGNSVISCLLYTSHSRCRNFPLFSSDPHHVSGQKSCHP